MNASLRIYISGYLFPKDLIGDMIVLLHCFTSMIRGTWFTSILIKIRIWRNFDEGTTN